MILAVVKIPSICYEMAKTGNLALMIIDFYNAENLLLVRLFSHTLS